MQIHSERPLTDEECADLAARAANARLESRQAVVKSAGASALVCGALAALTLAASDAPSAVVLGFWGALAIVFTAWIGGPWRRLMRGQVRALEDALRTNRARVIRIQSARVIEFEEEEDEGACYAFEHGEDASIFIVGQEFYEDDDFPNSDFSIVEILGEAGHPVDTRTVTHGRKLAPDRVVPAALKNRVLLPEHLEVVRTPLDRVEQALPPLADGTPG